MTIGALTPNPKFQGFDSSGNPLSGGKLYSYATGTSTPQSTYPTKADAEAGTNANANPTILDARGEANIWLSNTALYRLTLTTSADAAVWGPIEGVGNLFSSSTIEFSQLGVGATTRTSLNKMRENFSAKDFGALGNASTNDVAAFNLAATAQYLYSRTIELPGLGDDLYYKLSTVFTFTDYDGAGINGDGIGSLVCASNAAGGNAITIDSATHVRVHDIGITGISGSGNGLQIANGSHHPSVQNVWIGWVDGNGLQVASGVSGVYINVNVDQNSGFDPGGLGNGVRGNINNGIVVAYQASGLTTDQTFLGCSVDAAAGSGASDYAFKVGDATDGRVDCVRWYGGTLQGAADTLLVYMRATDSFIDGAYYEVTQNALEYPILIDRSRNVAIRNSVVQGDVQFSGTCESCGIEGSSIAGVSISTTSTAAYIRDVTYGHLADGPTVGKIKDLSGTADIRNTVNVQNGAVSTGDNMPRGMIYYSTQMDDWVGGGSPTDPCGLTEIGTGTLTRETSPTPRTGTYCAKLVIGNASTDYLRIVLPEAIAGGTGKQVMVEAWVYNLTTVGLANVGVIEGGTGSTYAESTHQANVWERVLVTFKPATGATTISITFGGAVGTIYIDSIKIYVDEFTNKKNATLDPTSATPDISSGGLSVATWTVAASATAVTGFTAPIVGEPFTLIFTGARTITYGAGTINLTGSVNFVSAARDTLTLVYGADGIYHEIGRCVA